MTLDEVFEKYPDTTEGFYRRDYVKQWKNRRPEMTEDDIVNMVRKYSVKWLKGLKMYGNEESREMGFIIWDAMIEDANADDWEIYNNPSEGLI